MNTSDARDDAVIDAFMRDYGASADPAAVVAKYAAEHPALASAFREFAAMAGRLDAAGPDPGPDRRLRAGEQLGDFRVVRFMTEGGMGEIYEAEQVLLSRRRVALKVIRHGHVSPAARERFLREQEVLAKLHQTNIVPVFAAGEREGLQYFAMQYVDGATLGHVVRFLRARGSGNGSGQTPSLAKLVESVAGPAPADGPTGEVPEAPPADRGPRAHVLTPEYVRSVAASLADVADALDAAHAAGVLHRDVKPSNLMAEKSGKCWVIDFGLAGLVGQAAGAPPATEPAPGPAAAGPALTETGGVMGTYAYMAPEQFAGQADRRSDVWSLGVTLYELLALERPFPGPEREDYQRQVATNDPSPLRDVPADLGAICRKALRRDMAERYQTAGAFAADLRRWLRHEPTVANPPWVGRRVGMWARREPGWASAVGVACAGGLALVGLLLWGLQLRADAAEAKAQRVERESELNAEAAAERVRNRNRLIQALSFQSGQFGDRTAGWRDRLWDQGMKLAREGKEPELRDRLAALLSGPDARQVPEFVEGSATAIAFDPAGRRLLMAGYRGSAAAGRDRNEPTRVRDFRTGEVKKSARGPVAGIGWRGDTPVQLIPPVARPVFELWDVDRNRLIEEFTFPDGLRPASPSVVVGLAAASLVLGCPVPAPGPQLADLVLSDDATHAAALVRHPGGGSAILVWHTGGREPAEVIHVIPATKSSFPDSLALSPDGSLLALGTANGRVSVWRLPGEQRPIATFHAGRSRITGLSFARRRVLTDPDKGGWGGVTGWVLAVGDAGGQVAVRDLGREDWVMRTRDSAYEIFSLAFSPDAQTLWTAGRFDVRCWDIPSGHLLLTIPAGFNWIPGVAVDPAGSRLALCGAPMFDSDGGVKLFDLEPGRGIQTLRGLTGQVVRVAVTPDGNRAAALSQDWSVAVWDVGSGTLLMRTEFPVALYADHADVRLTDDGRFLVVASGQEARRWELPGPDRAQARLTDTWRLAPAFSNRLAITPGGQVLLGRNETKSGRDYPTAGVSWKTDARCVRVYALPPGQDAELMATYDDHPCRVYLIHAVPDGSCFIADGTADGTQRGQSIVAYDGKNKPPLWSIPVPEYTMHGGSRLDSTGGWLQFRPADRAAQWRRLPFGGAPDEPGSSDEMAGVGRRFVTRGVHDLVGRLRLAAPGAAEHFLTLNVDSPHSIAEPTFTPTGRFLVWGNRDGGVNVCDLPAVRNALMGAGFPGW